MNTVTPNPKCAVCKCYWKPEETELKSSGLPYKTCSKCREYKREYNVKYFEKNREIFNQEIMCECGKTYYKRHYKRHCASHQIAV